MPDDSDLEPMIRVTLTFTLDSALLEVEGKSESTGRLYNGRFRKDVAASFHRAVSERLETAVVNKTAAKLRVNRENFTILPDQ